MQWRRHECDIVVGNNIRHNSQESQEKHLFANSSDDESDFAAVYVSQVQLYALEPYESDCKAESADSTSDSPPDTAEPLAVERDSDSLQNKNVAIWD